MLGVLRKSYRQLKRSIPAFQNRRSSHPHTAEEAKIRLFLTEYRSQINAIATSGSIKTSPAPRKRFAKAKARLILKTFKKGKRPKFPQPLLLTARYSESRFATGLMPDRKEKWVPILQRLNIASYNQLELKNFSFIDYPQHSLELLKKILAFECFAIESQLHFDDEYCVDVSAYLALAEMWPQLANVFRGGRMTVPIQKVVEALQLRKDLRMKFPGLKNVEDVWAFPKRQRRPAGTSRGYDRNLQPQSREKVVDDFCIALDDWLVTATASDETELSLAPQGRARFADIIGELLDNAERHSNPPGKDGGWSTAAFMAKRSEGAKDVYRCHMGFLSVGSSIAESLATASISTRSRVNKYIDLHRDKGLSRETLTTLVALQDGITRDHAAAQNNRGGVGFQEVLELINVIGVSSDEEHGPRMTIVSGKSCIRARAPYILGMRNSDLDPRTLWFNETNSFEMPPDQDFVFDLHSYFPGTLIGLTFVLSKDDLISVLDANSAS